MGRRPVFAATGSGAQLLDARGRLALALGDRERGLADLRACAAAYDKLGIGPTWAPWRSVLALAIQDDDRKYAERLVREELELGQSSGVPEAEGVALRGMGLLEGGDSGVELLRASVATLETTEARLEHARSLVELGVALRRRHLRAEAREHLSAGLELAHRCGAERLLARARDELHAAGARPRRLASSGVEALTPSELRVARLAAGGDSNVEIAQQLYLSVKTIETHLSKAYSKLGLTGRGSRAQLGKALAVE
jgi:DNA-binding CsgD family transcriptional regulator